MITDTQLFGASDGTLRFPDPLPPPCPLHFNAGSHGLIRKELWEKVGGFAEDAFLTGGVDFDFWLSSVERGARVIHVSRDLYWYRTHEASASATSLPYDTYLINDEIWRRHGTLFDAMNDCPGCTSERRGAIFRANGYRTSAQAWLARGERWRAIRLAARAVSLDPAEPKNVKVLARAVVPRSALMARRPNQGSDPCGAQCREEPCMKRRDPRSLIAGLCLGLVAATWTSCDSRTALDVIMVSTFEYARRDGVPLMLDAYVPPTPGPHPAVLLIHGGGWEAGSRSDVAESVAFRVQLGPERDSLPSPSTTDLRRSIRIRLPSRTCARRWPNQAARRRLLRGPRRSGPSACRLAVTWPRCSP